MLDLSLIEINTLLLKACVASVNAQGYCIKQTPARSLYQALFYDIFPGSTPTHRLDLGEYNLVELVNYASIYKMEMVHEGGNSSHYLNITYGILDASIVKSPYGFRQTLDVVVEALGVSVRLDKAPTSKPAPTQTDDGLYDVDISQYNWEDI